MENPSMTFTGTESATLVVGTAGLFVCDVMPLISAGRSRGDNLAVGLTEGRLGRRRVRDQLTVEVEIGVDGRFDLEGEPVPCDTEAEMEAAVEDLQWAVIEFFEEDCDGRSFDLSVEFPSGRVREGAGHLEAFGSWRRADSLAVVALLLTIDAGILDETSPASP